MNLCSPLLNTVMVKNPGTQIGYYSGLGPSGVKSYPTNTRITANAANPISALMGIVRIQANMMRRATPHLTVLAPIVVPTPIMDEQMTCVVLTGIPAMDAPRIVAAPAVSAANPCTGRSLVILYPMVLTIRQPPERVPSAMVE